MSRIGIGVIGAGSISAMHLQSYAANPDVELVAIYDLNLARAQHQAAKFGVANAYATLEELLADSAVHAVSICTWNNSHAELAIAALEAGKNVLVEKPLSKTVAEAEMLAAAVSRTGKLLQVGFVRRFSSNAKLLRQFIDAGDLGEIYYAKASNIRRIGNPGGWFADGERAGGGPLIDIGVHVLDLCWFMMGSPKPVTVSGNTYHRLGNRANITNLERYKVSDYDPDKNDVEDLANALIRFENGASLYLETSYSLHALEDELLVGVYGEKGGAELEPSLRFTLESHDTVINVVPQVDLLTFNFDEGFQNEINHFVSLCRGEAEEIAPVSQGVEIMRMLSAIYESAALGREVAL
ncbi:putative dehydrogenase [Arthrobacter sp. UYCu512]|uniref:Gfo/Idh/MocA family protein n=1 Tax=Arthrobacter sp. UYCu512 TaxID=3156338 RepID=UPI00339B87AA